MYDHIGLKAKELKASARFYAAARAAVDAFLIDPDGNNVEAVCFK